ncbi:hypothetical protein FRC03_010145 [Tulasnella sp. 419]|nr:hypothetical protein FRC03_010145 [Tulasnella sp. 419]
MKLHTIFFIFHLIWIALYVTAAPILQFSGDDSSSIYEGGPHVNCLESCAVSASAPVFGRNVASRTSLASEVLLKARTISTRGAGNALSEAITAAGARVGETLGPILSSAKAGIGKHLDTLRYELQRVWYKNIHHV